MTDIIFENDGRVFGLRAQGILVRGGRVLLQKPQDSSEYAFPGEMIEFHWVPLERVERLAVYPVRAAELLRRLEEDKVEHLVYEED